MVVEKHAAVGRRLDEVNYKAGSRIDIAGFDLRELERQGRAVDPDLIQRVRDADLARDERFRVLDARRAETANRGRTVPPDSPFVLLLENLEETSPGESGWFGWRQARVTWPDGAMVDIPLQSFQNATFWPRYTYQVEASPASFIYGRQSVQYIAQAGFDIDPLPHGAATLKISGLDHDKPGITRIRIAVNDVAIFKGPNPFRKVGWSTHCFPIPGDAFAARGERPDANATRRRLLAEFDALMEEIDAFGAQVLQLAEAIDRDTASLRDGLVYTRPEFTPDWWRRGFMRGMCIKIDGKSNEPEYIAKSFRDAGLDWVYGYIHETQLDEYLAAFARAGLQYVPAAAHLLGRDKWDPRGGHYAANRRPELDEALRVLDPWRKRYANFAGVAIDEPKISDVLAQTDGIARQFNAYLREHGQEPVDTESFTVPERDNLTLWLHWQRFKKEHMADYWSWCFREMEQNGYLTFIIIQNFLRKSPQAASYVSMGRDLPIIATDLYNNARVWEGFAMRLLRSAASGRAIMVPGSGYSCKTPDRFRRSLAVGLAHADGMLQWTEYYSSKYRNYSQYWYVWQGRVAPDDRGRERLGNWDPDYWNVVVDMTRRAAKTEEFLVDTRPLASAVILFSERTAMPAPAPYFDNHIGVYSDLLRHYRRAFDVRFVESTPADRLAAYRAAVLIDPHGLTPDEIGRIGKWVAGGGTLITTPGTALHDALATKDAAGKGRVHVLPRKDMGTRVQDERDVGGLYGRGLPDVETLTARLLTEATDADPVQVEGVPGGVEIVLRGKGDAMVLHLLDWIAEREIDGVEIVVNAPGKWEVFYPDTDTPAEPVGQGRYRLRPFRVHDFIGVRRRQHGRNGSVGTPDERR